MKPTMTHVDDFIDDPYSDPYAAWMFSYFRLHACLRVRVAKFMEPHKLFCTYRGKKYRCVGASRLGDVWLWRNGEPYQGIGYHLRVDVADCSGWSDKP